jgi:hypothetical protein
VGFTRMAEGARGLKKPGLAWSHAPECSCSSQGRASHVVRGAARQAQKGPKRQSRAQCSYRDACCSRPTGRFKPPGFGTRLGAARSATPRPRALLQSAAAARAQQHSPCASVENGSSTPPCPCASVEHGGGSSQVAAARPRALLQSTAAAAPTRAQQHAPRPHALL